MKIKIKNPNYDLSIYESFIKDIYDPIEFKKIIPVMKPVEGGFEKTTFEPYPYQNMWTADNSFLKIAAKSRQIGFSFNEMIDSLHKAITTPNYLKMFVSLKVEDAAHLLTIIKNTIYLMEEEYRIPMVSERDNKIQFENGATLMAIPPRQAGRGKNGDVFIDEAAFIPRDAEMLTAILQTTVRGGHRVSVGSTPFGQRGEFHQIIKDAGWDTNTVWTDFHKGVQPYHIKNFMREYMKFRKEQESEWSVHIVPHWMCKDLTWERIKERARTEERLLQEYGVAFLDDSTSMLSYEIMLKHANPSLPQFTKTKVLDRPVNGIRRIAGLDVAVKHDDTAFVVFEKMGHTWYKRYRQNWNNVDQTVYLPEIGRMVDQWKLDKVYLDYTGMGVPIYADLIKYVPAHKVERVHLSNSMKRDIVYNLVSLYEAGGDDESSWKIITDHDTEMFDHLHRLRRSRTSGNKEAFTGKIDGQKDDIIWAVGMAVMEDIEILGESAYYGKVSVPLGGNMYGYNRYN